MAKINNEIITNYDVEKESTYLKLLNPSLDQLNYDKIFQISKNSLINEIIKTNELKKIIDINQNDTLINKIFKDFYKNLNFSNEKDFGLLLKSKNTYSISKVKEKIKIEFFWNKLIFQRFNAQIKINKEGLLEKIKNSDKYKNQYLLSEIFFTKQNNQNLEDQINTITQSIKDFGFSNSASLYSISESSKKGGKIGWVDEDNLSPKILDELYKIKKGQITNIIKIGNNFLILKIEDIKTKKIKVNKDSKLKEMIEFERNRQLNQYSNIYFNKIKINYSIDEK
ncbi:peptidylprolyl isomerase [Candidatus Pelagibacter sp.]|uniref:peptidylprolyl isomerase n=1 Tax=Candidatus Pelagibacter sp. TaxID=2024849 RepID=UPI003F835903